MHNASTAKCTIHCPSETKPAKRPQLKCISWDVSLIPHPNPASLGLLCAIFTTIHRTPLLWVSLNSQQIGQHIIILSFRWLFHCSTLFEASWKKSTILFGHFWNIGYGSESVMGWYESATTDRPDLKYGGLQILLIILIVPDLPVLPLLILLPILLL